MGEVWLAEQKHPVRRRVALKLIKAGMDSREIVLRFESERQALALMDHPAIAKVYDAGSTPQGRPYFAMEFVPGVPITAFCDSHKLSTRQRLELFIHVCEGVQHAHQKAIIHRDLKPSNILVSEVDGRPAPKIIDFGVAKALSQSLTDQPMFTRVGSILGTPEYMSPEQAASGGEDIDTRSDVYSLGVVLYELLAGAPPLDLKQTALLDLVRKIREEDTPKPSTKVRHLNSAGEKNSASRNAELALLSKELRGDLDCITLKCLEKDRSRRYGSPAEIAADLDRYLHDLPVLATPPSAAYRLKKFAQRNRGLIAALCAILIVLLGGTVVSTYQAVRARKAEHAALLQRDRADSEAATAQAVNDFLQNDLLSQVGADQQNSGAPPDPDVKVRTLVDRAAAAIPKKLAGKPMIEADLRKTLGETYLSLGLLKDAESQLRQAYELGSRTRGPEAKQTIETLQSLGTVEFNSGEYPEAAEHQKKAADAALRALGPQNPTTLTAMQSLAVDYMLLGDKRKAEPILKTTLQAQIKALGYDNASTLDTSDSLAALYLGEGHYAEAQKFLERGLPSYEKVFGPEHPNTMRERYGLARVMFGTGQYAGAEDAAAAVYNSNRKLLGPTHFKTLASARMLARIYAENGKIPQAESLMSDTLQKTLANVGSRAADTLDAKWFLADIYEKQNEYGKAETLRREVAASADRTYGASNPEAIISLQLLGRNLLAQHRYSEAAGYLQSANQRWKAESSGDWHRSEAQTLLGETLAAQNKFSEATPLLRSGAEGLKANAATMPAYEQYQVKDAEAALAQLPRTNALSR